MIKFLYGQDIYRSREEVKKIIGEYKKANPNWLDFARINCRDNEIEIFEEMRRAIDTVSMFNEKKLIVIENIFSLSQAQDKFEDELLGFIKKRKLDENKNIDIVFWDEEPNKGTKLFKFLQKFTVKEFNLLKGVQLKNWVKRAVEEQKGKIENLAIDRLMGYIGGDLWRMTNELNKLISYKTQATECDIRVEDVELLVKPEIDLNIFNMIDALGQKNKARVLKLFNQHLEKGDSDMYLWDRFIYQFRNLIKVKSGGKLDMHPFVVQKTKQQADNFDFEELKKIYSSLLAIDFDMKIGKTDFKTALELFVSAL